MSKFMGCSQSCTQRTRIKCTQSKINSFKCFYFEQQQKKNKINEPSIQFSNWWNQSKETKIDYHTG